MIKALGKYVIAELLTEQKTESGFLLPEEMVKDFKCAQIVSVGADVTEDVKVGDTIFVTGDYKQISYEGKTILILKSENLTIKVD